jgi:hypothetical protein
MQRTWAIAIGMRVQIDGAGYEAHFCGRVGTLVGYTRGGSARVRIDDASPWESSLAVDRDESTGLPIVIMLPECLQTEPAQRG